MLQLNGATAVLIHCSINHVAIAHFILEIVLIDIMAAHYHCMERACR